MQWKSTDTGRQRAACRCARARSPRPGRQLLRLLTFHAGLFGPGLGLGVRPAPGPVLGCDVRASAREGVRRAASWSPLGTCVYCRVFRQQLLDSCRVVLGYLARHAVTPLPLGAGASHGALLSIHVGVLRPDLCACVVLWHGPVLLPPLVGPASPPRRLGPATSPMRLVWRLHDWVQHPPSHVPGFCSSQSLVLILLGCW